MKALAFSLFLAFSLNFCHTIAPQPIKSGQASWTETGQDSGMTETPKQGEKGFKVGHEYIEAHDALLAKFGQRLFPPRKSGDREGITKIEGSSYYRVSDAVQAQHLKMAQWYMAEKGP